MSQTCVTLLKETESEVRAFKGSLEKLFLKMALVVTEFQTYDWSILANEDLKEIEDFAIESAAIESAASYALRLSDKRLHSQISWAVDFAKVASSLAGVLLLRRAVAAATTAQDAAISKESSTRFCNKQ